MVTVSIVYTCGGLVVYWCLSYDEILGGKFVCAAKFCVPPKLSDDLHVTVWPRSCNTGHSNIFCRGVFINQFMRTVSIITLVTISK